MPLEHTIRNYDTELHRLDALIAEMGGLAQRQLRAALAALAERRAAIAAEVIERDREMDELEREVHRLAVRILALRTPIATDLRQVLSVFKMASEFERIGDLAANVAKRSLVLSELPPVDLHAILLMGRIVIAMIKDIIEAYARRDADKAFVVWLRDEEIDAMCSTLLCELLTDMVDNARNVSACTHLLFVAKNLERVGDHATNVAEALYFFVSGSSLSGVRPKRDQTVFELLPRQPAAPRGAEVLSAGISSGPSIARGG